MGGDHEADQARFEAALGDMLERGLIADAVVAKSQGDRDAMWAMRDDVEQLRTWGPITGFDVSLPPPLMLDYLEAVDAPILARWPDRRRVVFGHLGDGNLHLAFGVGDDSEAAKTFIDEAVYRPLQARGGSISAEHGIGLAKRPYLGLTRSALEIDLMRRLKGLFDPKGILNPGKIFC